MTGFLVKVSGIFVSFGEVDLEMLVLIVNSLDWQGILTALGHLRS